MTRDERQKLGIRRWIDSGGRAVLEWATGVGKTFGTIMLIQSLYTRNPNLQVLIAVPTEVLKKQWNRELAKNHLFTVCKVEIFNTIVKNTYNVNLLVVDEVHLSASKIFIQMYECIKYKYILGLTATWKRLDGREQYLEKYMTICDTITLEDALKNGWISAYRNYKVLLDVDLSEYYELNRKFQAIFSIFKHDFNLVMSLVQSPKKALVWAKKHNYEPSKIRGYLAVFMKLLRQRKQFVMSHPKKFEIANKILDARQDKKCIVFTSTVRDAEQFKYRSLVLHSKKKKNENSLLLEQFNSQDFGTITSPKSLDTGVDVKGLSVGVSLTCNSSQVTNTQKLGRICRLEDNKQAEMFVLVIKSSIEETWFNNSNQNVSYITIDESQLNTVLQNKDISTRLKKGIVDFDNRF